LERRHRGMGPVVRDACGDRETGAAISAVGERIAVAALRWVLDLLEALRTGGHVGRNGGVRTPSVPALVNRENRRAAFGGDLLDMDLLDGGKGRRIDGQRSMKRGHGLGRALDLDQDAIRVVQDEAGEAQSVCKPVDEGSKADALYRASNTQSHPDVPHRRIVAPRGQRRRDEVSSRRPSQWVNLRSTGVLPTCIPALSGTPLAQPTIEGTYGGGLVVEADDG
jgi:hypothetical protein